MSTGIVSRVITVVSTYLTSHDVHLVLHLVPQSPTSSVVCQIPFVQLRVYQGPAMMHV